MSGVITRNLGGSFALAAPFGAPGIGLGPSSIGSMDPMLGFTKGTGISYSGGLDSMFKPSTVGIMGQESDIEEAANAVITHPVSFKIDERTSHRIDEQTGEGQLLFVVDMRALRFLSDPEEARTPTEFMREEKDMNTANPMHELTKVIGFSSLMYYLRSEEGRRVFGTQRDTRLLMKVFRFIGVQQTEMLPDQRIRDEQTMTTIPAMVWRFPNIWLAQNGHIPATGSECYLVPTRYDWTGPKSILVPSELDKKGSYTRGVEWEKRKEDTKLVESLRSTRKDAGDKWRFLEDSAVFAAGKRGELDAGLYFGDDYYSDIGRAKRNVQAFDADTDKSKQQHYWQYNPFHCFPQQRPRRMIHCNLSWASKVEYIGKVLDTYEGDPSSVHQQSLEWRDTARKAIFPEEEGDDYKTHLHTLGRIELSVRANPGKFFTG